MRQYTETNHSLEMREIRGDVYTCWYPPTAGMLKPAVTLAYHGRLMEAIELAEDIIVKNYGHMNGLEFRCVTTTKTVTTNSGLIDEDRLRKS